VANTNPLPDFHPEATADLEARILYLRKNNADPSVIGRLLDEVIEMTEKIRLHPKTWPFVKGSRMTRKVQLTRFHMTAFYQIQTNGVAIILELCGPGQIPRWAKRAPKND
jgi:hypothetical protein